MNRLSLTPLMQVLKKLNPFLALSRTPHGLIDMTAPMAAALLCMGHFPPLDLVVVGLVTVFAGYTAVYALNDLVDLRTDKQKVRIGGYADGEDYLDGALTRHPMAKGVLGLPAGLAWTVGWAVVAMVGAYWLNPLCLYLFLFGCLLEGIYCLLWRVTPLRALVNGIVKTLGAVAAVYAVDPDPPVLFVLTLVLWLFCWEIGGQNIPADWTDIDEDRHFKAKTIPLLLGTRRAGVISLLCLVTSMLLHFALLLVSPPKFGSFYLVCALALNAGLLLAPAIALAHSQERRNAMDLFNKASYYPMATLLLVLVKLIV